MLKNLQISNVALIDNLSIDFASNLNVLSGETGAGKSIVIDALNFVIGSKTSKSLIKQDKDFMKVQALFSGNFSPAVISLLDALDVEFDGEILYFLSGRLDMIMTRRHLKRFSDASMHPLVHLRHIPSFQIPNRFLDGFVERVSKLAL